MIGKVITDDLESSSDDSDEEYSNDFWGSKFEKCLFLKQQFWRSNFNKCLSWLMIGVGASKSIIQN